MEARVLDRWREDAVFEQSLEQRRGGRTYVFYEGPPTANGRPGSHHVLARVFKDIYPRFHTMRGALVERRGGWDCHGLPVELEVERQLGISGKPEIEAYGIERFNALCRESVLRYVEEWEQLTERIGFWLDTEHAYRTMDTPYVESVWWSLAELWKADHVYEGFRVVPYCTRCGTALSSHEVALGYKDVEDPSVYVTMPLRDGSGRELLVWTTTPWTLPANQAAAVNPEVTYVEAEVLGRRLILAESLVASALGEEAAVAGPVPLDELVGAEYEPPFPYVPGAHRVVPAEFVTTADGTGIVHIAPAFGQDDLDTGHAQGLDAPRPVGTDGRFTDAVPIVSAKFFKDADPLLIEDLRERGRLLRSEQFVHGYPHCWRDGSPLMNMATPSWYIGTSAVRDRMLELNSEIGWHPEHVRDGRFGKWLEGNVDWAISRSRYWGTPLPFWRCGDCDEVTAIGSIAELRARARDEVPEDFDPHRPYVDDVTVTCPACGGASHRVPEVLDVWYDSGAMPFAQLGYPHSGADLDAGFPADFISEALDQTRGWFYSLLAESTLLFDTPSYRNVVCLGLILDSEGQKMSKSKGNVIEPWAVLDTHGADAFRWYLLTAQTPGESFRFSLDAVAEAKRRFLLTLWNTYSFLVGYASLADGWSPGDGAPAVADRPAIDRWALSRLDATVDEVTELLEAYDATTAGRRIEAYVDDLSNWYVRASRARFWAGRFGEADDDSRAAFSTLHECIATIAKLLAPFCPFVADELYANLVAGHDPAAPASVHLADWPTSMGRRDAALETGMAAAREAVSLGRGARAEAKIKVRLPLSEAVVASAGNRSSEIDGLVDLIKDELNVKSVRFVSDPGELVDVALKPNFRELGPRFGKEMKALAAVIGALPSVETARRLDAGEAVTVTLGDREVELSADDILREARASEGYVVGNAGGMAVGLATELTPELRREGLSRDVIRLVQDARRTADLQVDQRIRLHLDGSGLVREAIDAYRGAIASEALATELTVGHGAPFAGVAHEEHVVDGEPLAIRLDVAEPGA